MILLKSQQIKIVWIDFRDRLNLIIFSIILRRPKLKKIWIVDLDNTIANTWPLRKKGYNEKRIFTEVIAFEGVLNFLKSKIDSKDLFIVLTARPYNSKKITEKWIKNCFWGALRPKVFLVRAPANKLNYIELAIKYDFKVTYIDDLAYNHENNNIKFYDDVIDKVNKLPINYIGYKELLKLQE